MSSDFTEKRLPWKPVVATMMKKITIIKIFIVMIMSQSENRIIGPRTIEFRINADSTFLL